MDRKSRRGACGSMRGPACLPAARRARQLCPATPRRACWSTPSTTAKTYQMPPKSKLPPEEIATLTDWVRRGAPWGVEIRTSSESPGAARIPGVLSKQEFQARARYWSFQPLKKVAPPAVTAAHAGWARNPIDCFILAALDRHNLVPAPEAGKRTLIRRLFFDLTGLPPQPEDVETFLNDQGFDAYEKLVDRLLASPHYGERWARHWLDLVRYAETAGHEFDYEIPNAFRYRDYVIRALNLRRALRPARRRALERRCARAAAAAPGRMAITSRQSGPGSTFLGEGVHSPVDIREEQMRRIDNQLDVLSKTFLGLTLACARCHDHKFDPIKTEDYYALAGFLASSRHQQAFSIRPSASAGSPANFASSRKSCGQSWLCARSAAGTSGDQAAAIVASVPHSRSLTAAVKPESASGAAPGQSSDQVFDDFNRDQFRRLVRDRRRVRRSSDPRG